MNKTALFFLYFLLAGLLFSNNNAEVGGLEDKIDSLYSYSVKLIYPEELNSLLDSEVYILDSRTEKEYNVSHIKNATFVDFKTFSIDMLNGIPKDSKVIIYCTIGYRSEKIGEKLLEAGYINVLNLYGGLLNWVNLDYKVYNVNGVVKDIHTYSVRWGRYLKNEEYK